MNAYSPGLKVVRRCRQRSRRVLPIPGDVLVAIGDKVGPATPIAQTFLPGAVVPVDVAHLLGVSAGDVPQALGSLTVGSSVRSGEQLAKSQGIFGWFQRSCNSPADGTIEAVSEITGQVILRGPPRPYQVPAYLAGTVVEIIAGQGAVVEADATLVQGIFGIGGEAHGEVYAVVSAPSQLVTAETITSTCKGKIVIGGGRVTADGLRAARDAGVAAIVTGGIDDQDLKDFLGYDLGVATTGSEKVGLTLIITEGFGDVAMADRTWQLLISRVGAEAACNGATQIRAGVLRPEVVIPWPEGSGKQEHVELPPARPLTPGAAVRIVRDPYFGTLGTVANLPAEPVVLASGSRARVLEVQTLAGELLVVPRANVELIED